MTFKIKFEKKAKKAFEKLGETVKNQFKIKLKKIIQDPHNHHAKLRGHLTGCYKIKLRSSGYRLVYKVEDNELIILVLAVGKRDKNDAYTNASQELNGR